MSVECVKLDLVAVNQERDILFHFLTGSPKPVLFSHLTNGKFVGVSITKIHISFGS